MKWYFALATIFFIVYPTNLCLTAEMSNAGILHLQFDEGVGAILRDSSNNGNDGEILSGRRTGDESGGALECDGQAQGAVVKKADALRLGQEFTISAWVNLSVEPKDMKGPWPSVVYRFAPGVLGFRLGFLRDNNTAFFKWGDGTSIHGYGIQSKKASWERGWHHLVGVFSKIPRIYVDGMEENSTPLTGGFKDGGGELFVGRDGFCGIVDEVALFNRALSREEVQALYMSGLAYAGARNVRIAAVTPIAKPPQSTPQAKKNIIEGDTSFESGLYHYWEASGVRIDHTTAVHGAACAVLDGTERAAHIQTSDITVDVNRPYTFSGFLQGKGKASLAITSVSPNDPYDGNWSKTQSVNLSESWQRFSVTLAPGWNWTNKWSDVPKSGHKYRASLRVEKGSLCRADALQFEEGDAPSDYVPPSASISITSGKPGNVFLVGEPVNLAFMLYLSGGGTASLRYAIKDYAGTIVCKDDKPLTFSPHGTASLTIEPQLTKKGFFIVEAGLERQDKTICKTDFTFCLVPTPQEISPKQSFFGIQGPLSEMWAEAMRRIGVKWFRLGFSWGAIERKRGEFHWEFTDERVKLLSDRGIAIMGLISSTPEWARTEVPKDEWRVWAYPPRDMNDLAHFMELAAARYLGKVDVWEIWNESYLDYFKINSACGRPKSEVYAEVLKAAYRGAKKGNPECKVCTNPIGSKFGPFGYEVLALAPDAFDVLNVHPYTGSVRIGLGKVTTPEEYGMRQFLLDAARLTREKARGQEVWNSEQGYTLDCDAAPDSEDARLYAKLMVRSLILQRSVPIRRAFWFLTYDGRMCNNRKGLWRNGMQPLPGVAAYATLAHILDGAEAMRELKLAHSGVCAFAFAKGNGGVVALWQPSTDVPEQILRFKTPGTVTVLDFMGNPCTLAKFEDEACTVPVSDTPVYIVSETVSCEQLAATIERGTMGEVPLPALAVKHTAKKIHMDGNLDDWPSSTNLLWDDKKMYLGLKVAENPYPQTWSANLLPLGNCLRLRLGQRNDFHEFLTGIGYNGAQVYRSRGTSGAEAGLVRDVQVAITLAGDMTTYEIAVPFSVIGTTPTETLVFQCESIIGGKATPIQSRVRLVFQP